MSATSEYIAGAELDFFHGQRQLKITLRGGKDGIRSVFLPLPNQRCVGELAEDSRAFAQQLAPRVGRPRKRDLIETKGGGK